MQAGMLLLVFLLTASAQDFNTSLSDNAALISNVYSSFVILSLPPCTYAGKNASVTYSKNSTNSKTESFVVPPCRFRREVVEVARQMEGFTVTDLLGFRVGNLKAGTQYDFRYTIDNTTNVLKSNIIQITTSLVTSNVLIDEGFKLHSGGMIVITILLSFAMLFLIIGVIVVLVLGNKS
ncbi:uroplakin-2 [Latimeria chalumnae]|uniref:uroplakin-2 n=1 Tax=Latimeria chalumnae TaxID=7897 RepID=UPI0003C181D7|nr:PREDICTED: uroplakin-2 [Latimeria chalumnae]|eukprot:XP_005988187.1 PREDICTED: uroplakin-2 [Latimeria chalumnae]